MHRSIFLVGPMGSGKTAVGRELARRLGLRFVDIPFIFEKEGEAGFRQREREVIDDLTLRPGLVLATGGGAVLLPENRERLVARGTVVYLETSVRHQVERTRRSRHRPLLQAADPAQRLADLMQLREPLYRGVATVTVRTDGRKVGAVADEIVAALGRGPVVEPA